MTKFLLTLTCIVTVNILGNAIVKEEPKDLTLLKEQITTLQTNQNHLKNDVAVITSKAKKSDSRIKTLESENKVMSYKLDSIQTAHEKLAINQQSDKSEMTTQIGETNNKVQAYEDIISSRTLWGFVGIIVLLMILIGTIIVCWKKFKKDTTSLHEVRKAQNSLVEVQERLQEESLKLDNKLIEVIEKHVMTIKSVVEVPTEDKSADHSLALKVADEIIRIETNLSRMDSSIKGFKQLSKAVERIKDNFSANGYEIVNMLGKQYVPGMRVIASFVTDESLKEGQQIITKIIKPQVNYKQEMIQAAQIEVSQPE